MSTRGRPPIDGDQKSLQAVAMLLASGEAKTPRSAICRAVKRNDAAIRRLQRKWRAQGGDLLVAAKAAREQEAARKAARDSRPCSLGGVYGAMDPFNLRAIEEAMDPFKKLWAIEEAMDPFKKLRAIEEAMDPFKKLRAIEEAMDPFNKLRAIERAMDPGSYALTELERRTNLARFDRFGKSNRS